MTRRHGHLTECGDQVAGPTWINDRSVANGSTGDRQVLVAHVAVYPPAGRRSRHLAVVTSCPHCRRAHVHFGRRRWDLASVIKFGSCGGAYKLRVVRLAVRGDAA